jgi:exopolysaccharide production protein ExoZ
MERLRSVQILRGLAALGVVQIHVATVLVQRPNYWHSLGGAGVDIFFVISGFVMVGAARRARTALAFGLQRFLRVVPLYWLFSLPFIAIAVAGHGFTPAHFARTFLFWQGVDPLGELPVLGVGWTLCFEIWFYVMIASALAAGRLTWIFWIGVSIASLALCIGTQRAIFSFLGNPLFLEFGLGALVAVLPRTAGPAVGGASVGMGLAALALWTGLGLNDMYNSHRDFLPVVAGIRVALAGLPAALIVWGAIQCESWLSGGLVRFGGYLGDASYSIYLTHLIVLYVLQQNLHSALAWAALALIAGFVLCGCVGVAAYELIERPLMRLSRKLKVPRAASESELVAAPAEL